MFRDADLDVPIHSIGVPLEFIEHSKRAEILTDLGMTAQNIAHQLVAWSSSLKDDLVNEITQVKQPQADESAGR